VNLLEQMPKRSTRQQKRPRSAAFSRFKRSTKRQKTAPRTRMPAPRVPPRKYITGYLRSGRIRGRSFTTGDRIRVSNTNRRTFSGDAGTIVPGHSLSIGKPRPVSKLVSFNFPLNALQYSFTKVTPIMNSGLQSVDIFGCNECSYLKDIFNNFSNMNYDATGSSNGNANNENMNNGGTIAPDTTRIPGLLNKVYLEKVKLMFRICNNMEIGCRLEIIPIVCRRDILGYNQSSPTNAAPSRNPIALWKQLMLQQVGGTATGASPQIPAMTVNSLGLRPYDRRFKSDMEKFYKMLTPAKFFLQGGQNTTYNFTQYLHKALEGQEIQDYVGAEGISLFFMFISEGTLVGSTSAGIDKISTGSASVDVIMDQTNFVRACNFARGHTFSYSRADVGIARADQQFIDPASGDMEVGNDYIEATHT